MSGIVNDAVLRALAALMPLGAVVEERRMLRRIRERADSQRALRDALGITPTTPISAYDDATRARVEHLVAQTPGARGATTSGTTGAPKVLAYTRERLKLYQRDSVSFGIRTFARLHLERPRLFILASLKVDDSFASLVLHERATHTPWLAGLIEPSRLLAEPRLQELVREHGANAVRLWLLLVTDPGILYATNPSTLATFFTDVTERWSAASALVRRHAAGDLAGDPALARVVRRAGSADAKERLARAARTEAAPPIHELLPGLRAFVTWDGGSTTAFLAELRRHLPAARFTHVPLYSMSTEAIETVPVFVDDPRTRPEQALAFLPLGARVLVELLPFADGDTALSERAPHELPDDPTALIRPAQAVPGARYTLIVSDPWGLVRYQTEDVFLCARLVHGLPDLRFLFRRGLAWSFTGEKLTGEQLAAAFSTLRARFPVLSEGVELTVVPAGPGERAPHESVPGYVLVLAPTRPSAAAAVQALPHEPIADALDAALRAHNHEFENKRASGRLGGFTVAHVPYEALAQALDRRSEGAHDEALRPWESQFKLNPLVKVRWGALRARLSQHGSSADASSRR